MHLDMVPENHSLMDVKKLEEDGQHAFDTLINYMTSETISRLAATVVAACAHVHVYNCRWIQYVHVSKTCCICFQREFNDVYGRIDRHCQDASVMHETSTEEL